MQPKMISGGMVVGATQGQKEEDKKRGWDFRVNGNAGRRTKTSRQGTLDTLI